MAKPKLTMKEKLPKLTIARLSKYLSKTKEVDGCWVWQGSTVDGYGRTSYGWRVHRMTYYAATGEHPPVIDHLCRNRLCCNPKHLEAVDTRTNLMRGNTRAATNAAKTHCKRGHEFTAQNTYIYKGQRTCRKCAALKTKRYMQRKRNSYAYA